MMIKKILLCLLLMNLASCSTGYQKKEWYSAIGFTEKKLSKDKYTIMYSGASSQTLESVKDYALLRAAQIAKQNEFEYFYIQHGTVFYKSTRGNFCIDYRCTPTTNRTPMATFTI